MSVSRTTVTADALSSAVESTATTELATIISNLSSGSLVTIEFKANCRSGSVTSTLTPAVSSSIESVELSATSSSPFNSVASNIASFSTESFHDSLPSAVITVSRSDLPTSPPETSTSAAPYTETSPPSYTVATTDTASLSLSSVHTALASTRTGEASSSTFASAPTPSISTSITLYTSTIYRNNTLPSRTTSLAVPVSSTSPVAHHLSLLTYNLGVQTLLPGAFVEDGCISTATNENGPLVFTNSSDACGPSDPNSRFKRYFGTVVIGYVDLSEGVFNITVRKAVFGRRRAEGDATFQYLGANIETATSSTSFTSTTAALASTAMSSKVILGLSSTSISIAAPSHTAKTTTSFGVPTGYASPLTENSNVYNAPTAGNAIPPSGNNIFKGSAMRTSEVMTSLVVALVMTF
ncbi:hypothetical protein HDU99_003117 [Rhizoclosmatium hyalinum]|nr:hypothetical protein HDU99_003117 [Rhizoclosmatium hyalinum]